MAYWLGYPSAFFCFYFLASFGLHLTYQHSTGLNNSYPCLSQYDQTLPDELVRLLKLRWWISMAGVLPLLAVFVLMVYKPDIPAVADWFR